MVIIVTVVVVVVAPFASTYFIPRYWLPLLRFASRHQQWLSVD